MNQDFHWLFAVGVSICHPLVLWYFRLPQWSSNLV